ncbi:MAG: hypothetical protein ABIH63_02655 [archaeon]
MRRYKIKDRKIVRQREFPSFLDSRLTSILSCVNSESKQTDLILLDENPKTGYQLKKEFDEVTSYQFSIKSGSHGGYCKKTFVPIGMVCEEKLLYNNFSKWVQAWSISDAGEHFGKPIAAFTLKKANEYNLSFLSLLGVTQSGGESRSPYNKVMILDMLSDTPMRRTDLAELLKLAGVCVKEHLEELRDLRFINYESTSTEQKGWSEYKWTGKNLSDTKQVSRYKALTEAVKNLILDNPRIVLECNRTSEVLDHKHLSDITNIFSGLVKQDILEVIKFKGSYILSNAEITVEGREFYNDYCKKVINALRSYDNPELRLMRQILNEYNKDYGRLVIDSSRAICLYKKVLPRFKGKSLHQRCEQVYNIIQSHPLGIRPRDLDGLIGVCPAPHLNILLQNNLIYKERKGKIVLYKPVISENIIRA